MAFMTDKVELLQGQVIIFRRTDTDSGNWYCRIKLPDAGRYKTICLKTKNLPESQNAALSAHAEVLFKVKHELPIFDRTFAEVAKEFSDFERRRSEAQEITHHRWRVMDSHINQPLQRFCGSLPITKVGQEKWNQYPSWRKATRKLRGGGVISNGTIRDEMNTLRIVLRFAARKNYIRPSQLPSGKLPIAKARREDFTLTEYRKLYRHMRSWVKKARNGEKRWIRTMIQKYILIMTNTGMRPSEARNLRWGDVSSVKEEQTQTVQIRVSGKGKKGVLVAPASVWNYFEDIRSISKATKDSDFVFTTYRGSPSRTMYVQTIAELLKECGLKESTSGAQRTPYCFRHTYATLRLMAGVDVYLLAKQMRTSVKMIEDHYGHVTPASLAEQILIGQMMY